MITFGAPPVSTVDLTPFFKDQPAEVCGMALAFVNEHDPVPRSDTDYIRSLIDLYRSRLNTRLAAQNGKIASPKAPNTTSISSHSASQPESTDDQILPVWPLSASLLKIAGDIVVLKDSNLHEEEVKVSAVLVAPQDFSALLFVRSAVHSRAIYIDNIGRIKDGRFNGKDEW